MSIGSLTRARIATHEEELASSVIGGSSRVSLPIRQKEQRNPSLKEIVHQMGFFGESKREEGTSPGFVRPADWLAVAPGIALRASEYEERFAGVNIDGLRERMSPEMFTAFVRRIGSVRGSDNLDVVDITRPPEEE